MSLMFDESVLPRVGILPLLSLPPSSSAGTNESVGDLVISGCLEVMCGVPSIGESWMHLGYPTLFGVLGHWCFQAS